MGFQEIAEKTFALQASGAKIISLNIGSTNLPTPICAVEAAERYQTKAEYCPALGLPELREKIAERENCTVDEVVVGTGSKFLIYALHKVLLGKGDTVLTPGPSWPVYKKICGELGLNFKLHRTSFEDKWSFNKVDFTDVNLFILCNPMNPTSMVYKESLIKTLIEDAQKKGVPVLIDEAYKGLAFNKIPRYQGAICARSFSKEFNMEGWRLGYLVAPKDIVTKIGAFIRNSITCTPGFVQMAGLACLENEESILDANVALWKKRLKFSEEKFKESGFSFQRAESGMYLFVTHPNIKDADRFALNLLDHSVAVSPGSGFGNYNQFIRVTLNQEPEIIEEAIEVMNRLF